VQTGLRLADAVQVLDGLAPGEELITSGILQLRPGMKVQVKRSPGLFRTSSGTAPYQTGEQPLPGSALEQARQEAME
jgi:hypothetical protein